MGLDLLTEDEAAATGLVCGRIGEGYIDISGSHLDLSYESPEWEAAVDPEWLEVHTEPYVPPVADPSDPPPTEPWLATCLPIENRTVVWIVNGFGSFWLELPGCSTGLFETSEASPTPGYVERTPLPKLDMNLCLLDYRAPFDWQCQSDIPGGRIRVEVTEYGEAGTGYVGGSIEAVLLDRNPYEFDLNELEGHACAPRTDSYPPITVRGSFRVPRVQ